MTDVDDRIVSIEFDNSRFEERLGDTIKSLDKLNETLKLTGASQGLDDVSSAMDSFDTSSMAEALDNISSKFSALGAIGFSVLQHLTEGVLDFAKSGLDKVLDPILSGGKQRATNIENAKFAFEGLGLDVTKAMDSAKKAVLGTAFGLDEAAKAAAVFGGAGVKVGDDMTQALRGIAGTAAITNSSFSEISDIFTGIAATGKLGNQDLLQFATRGLDAAAILAKAMHTSEANVHELARDGKISFAQFSKAMDDALGKHAQDANKTFQGSVANLHAALSRLGAAFFTPLLEKERDLFNALSPAIDKIAVALDPVVKMFTKLVSIPIDKIIGFVNKLKFDDLKKEMENVGKIFNNVFRLVAEVWTAIKVAFRDIFPKPAVSTLLRITTLVAELTKHFIIARGPLEQIRQVFRGVFALLEIGITIIRELWGTFKLIFKIINTGAGEFLGLGANVGNVLTKLNNFLVAGGALHRFFERVNEAIIKASDYLGRLIGRIAELSHQVHDEFESKMDGPIKKLEEFKDKIKSFFDSDTGDGSKLDESLGRVEQRADQLTKAWDRVKEGFERIKEPLKKVGDEISNFFQELGQKVADAFKPGDFDSAVDLVNVGLLGGIAVLLKKFLDGDLLNKIAPNLIEKISGTFDQLTNTLKTMQAQVKAEIIEKIAISIGIMAASLLVLSLINSKDLTKALAAITVSMGELIGAMVAMDKLVSSNTAAVKLGIISAALIEVATAGLILSGAIAVLAALNPDRLSAGLTAIAVGLGLLVGAAKILEDEEIFGGVGAAAAGVALILMATSLAILAGVVALFATMNFDTLAKGLGAVTIALGIMVGALKLLAAGPLEGAGAVLAGTGLLLMATALNILAGAVKIFATMSVGDLAKGLIAIAGGLGLIALAMQLMPVTLPITASGMVILGIALNALAGAVTIMAHLSLGELAKSIGAFAGLLIVLAAGMIAMEGALPGAAALGVVALSMSVLVKVMEKLAALDIGQIVKGLAAMAAVIGLFAGLSLLLSEAIVPMLGLGAGLIVIGAGFALLGGGLFLLGKGLEAIAKSGVAGAEALGKAMGILLRTAISEITQSMKDLLNAVPLLLRLVEAVLGQLLDTITKLAPKLAKALIALFINGLNALETIYPKLVEAGFKLLLALLSGIRDNIGQIVLVVADIIVNFLTALSDNLDKIVEAAILFLGTFLGEFANHTGEIIQVGLNMLINLLAGIASGVQQIIDAGTQLLINFLYGITSNLIKITDAVTLIITTMITQFSNRAQDIANAGTAALVAFLNAIGDDAARIIDAVGRLVAKIINELGNKAQDLTNAGTTALIKFLDGLAQNVPDIIRHISTMIGNILDAISTEVPKFVGRGADAMIQFLNGMADAIRSKAPELGKALANVADAMIDGFGDAFVEALRKFATDRLPGPLGAIIGTFLDKFVIKSPSRVMMDIGDKVAAGFTIGISDGLIKSVQATDAGGDAVISSMNRTVERLSSSLGELGEFNPTITPVLDLTKVQLEATKIDGLMKVSALTPTISTENANLISNATTANTDSVLTPDQKTLQDIKFEQNIYAPTTLSVNDIYRNTRSQITLAKEELQIP